MRGKTFAPLFMGALLVLPAIAMPVVGQEQDEESFFDERMAELRALLAEPSSLTTEDVSRLMDAAAQGETLSGDAALELARWLLASENVDGAIEGAVREWVALTLLRGFNEAGVDAWQQGTWDDYGVALTLVYLAAATVDPTGEMLPHNLRIPGIYIDLRLPAGCSGNLLRGYCFIRLEVDLMALAALDWHFSTDVAALQLPLSIEIRLNWSCGWTGCQFWITTAFPQVLIATDASWVFAYPAMAGEVATRVTDMDLLVSVYDRLGGIAYQKGRELTSAAIGGGTPVPGAVPGGTPGLGDLHAVAPAANYYGLQVPPEAPRPALPALPATPALPAPAQALVDQAKAAPGSVHMRVRDDFGTAPVDSTGLTAVFTMSQVRAWHLSIGIVRWKNIGTGAVPGVPEPPASFYYDAGSYFTGGGSNQWTMDHSIRHGVI